MPEFQFYLLTLIVLNPYCHIQALFALCHVLVSQRMHLKIILFFPLLQFMSITGVQTTQICAKLDSESYFAINLFCSCLWSSLLLNNVFHLYLGFMHAIVSYLLLKYDQTF